MDETLAAELREQYRTLGLDEDTIDEVLAQIEPGGEDESWPGW
jgi:hypothetical protein